MSRTATDFVQRTILVALVMTIAAVVLYRSAYEASDLNIPPDEVEYTLMGHRLAVEGRWDLDVAGRDLPSTSPPWFSLFLLAPTYLVLGEEIGNAIYSITICAVVGVLLAFWIGRRTAGEWAGVIAALGVLALPTYRMWSGHVMTDVPCAVLMLGVCAIFVRVRTSAGSYRLALLLAGTASAVGALFRPTCAAAVLPFVLQVVRKPRRAGTFRDGLIVLTPLAVISAMTLLYNRATFGTPWRNGYQFWVPVPYDYAALTFSSDYLLDNVRVAWGNGLLLLSALTALAWVVVHVHLARRVVKNNTRGASARAAGRVETDLESPQTVRMRLRPLAEFLLLGTGPIVLFHLVYFYSDGRFFLPSLVITVVLLAALIGVLLERVSRRWILIPLAALACLVIVLRHEVPAAPPWRRIVADGIRRNTPRNAVVISALDPVYLAYMASHGSRRRIVPLSRRVDYANTLIAPERIATLDPPPHGPTDHRCRGLRHGGAQEAIEFVAEENLDALERVIAAGRPVFLDTSYLAAEDQDVLDEMEKRWQLVPRAERLLQLMPFAAAR